MKLLLYCVFRRPRAPKPPKLLGVDAARVRFVSQGRLSAAVSSVAEASLTPTLVRIQAYERVVEAIFAERTIVPMRFGSLLTSEEGVAEYLRLHEKTLTQLLQKLTGDVEMGIRVAVPPMSSPRKPGTPRGSRLRAGAAKRAGAGHAYLAAAAERVRQQDEEPAYDVGGLVGRYRQALRGLFDAVSVQPPAILQVEIGDGGKLQLSSIEGNGSSRRLDGQADLAPSTLALSFLVPEERLDAFREAFNRAARKEPAAHLSGPWPPYSFVVG